MPKNIFRVALLAGFATCAAVASPLCTTDTLANYISGGPCQMGSIEFSAFSFTGFPDPTLISVTPNAVNSTFQFGINPAFYSNGDGPLINTVLSITFSAEELNGAAKIKGLGSAFVNNISADDENPDTATLSNSAKCTSGCASNAVDFSNTTLLAGSGAGLTLLGANGVQGPITVELSSTLNLPSTEEYQEVHYSNLTVTVTDGGAVGSVPEPGTVALLMGGLGALVIRKRFVRA